MSIFKIFLNPGSRNYYRIVNMKHYFDVFTLQHIALNILLFIVMLSLILPIVSASGGETDTDHKVISLTVKDEPLGDVLKKISMATGYEISLDNKGQSHLVTVSLEKVSLHKGLKRILRNLNNVIIYGSDKKIEIIIYDKTTPEAVSSAPSTDKSFNGTLIPRDSRSTSSRKKRWQRNREEDF